MRRFYRWPIAGTFTIALVTALTFSSSTPAQITQNYANAHIKNTTNHPLCLIEIMKNNRRKVGSLCITGKEAYFDSKGILSKGSGYIQMVRNQFYPIIVTIIPSDTHRDDLNATQIELHVTRIEFDENAKAASVSGLQPMIKRLLGTLLKTTSTGKLVATDGLIHVPLEGGHTLAFSLGENGYARLNNADFLLTSK